MYQPSRIYLVVCVFLVLLLIIGYKENIIAQVQGRPTMRPAKDPFYDHQVVALLSEFEKWKKELGTEDAIQRTIDWINGELPSGPPIPEGITKAYTEPYCGTSLIVIEFRDGMVISIETEAIDLDSEYEEIEENSFKKILTKNNLIYIAIFFCSLLILRGIIILIKRVLKKANPD